MFNEYGNSAYEPGDIERVLSALNGVSQEDFFNRYVYGTEKIPVARFLALAGIETAEENGQTVFRIRDDADPETNRIRRGLFGD
jgi:predicted metalloprotease with PDZ domain